MLSPPFSLWYCCPRLVYVGQSDETMYLPPATYNARWVATAGSAPVSPEYGTVSVTVHCTGGIPPNYGPCAGITCELIVQPCWSCRPVVPLPILLHLHVQRIVCSDPEYMCLQAKTVEPVLRASATVSRLSLASTARSHLTPASASIATCEATHEGSAPCSWAAHKSKCMLQLGHTTSSSISTHFTCPTLRFATHLRLSNDLQT